MEENRVIKDRFRKTYRIKEIDERLRKFRTKREAKVLDKLQAIDFPCPKLIFNNKKDTIEMEFIDGKLVKDILDKSYYINLSKEIG